MLKYVLYIFVCISVRGCTTFLLIRFSYIFIYKVPIHIQSCLMTLNIQSRCKPNESIDIISAYSTRYPQMISHPSTNQDRSRFAAEI